MFFHKKNQYKTLKQWFLVQSSCYHCIKPNKKIKTVYYNTHTIIQYLTCIPASWPRWTCQPPWRTREVTRCPSRCWTRPSRSGTWGACSTWSDSCLTYPNSSPGTGRSSMRWDLGDGGFILQLLSPQKTWYSDNYRKACLKVVKSSHLPDMQHIAICRFEITAIHII